MPPNGTLPPGGYLVHWTTLSAVDGHRTQGAFGFAYGNATVPLAPAASTPPVHWQSALGKSLAFIGLAFILGPLTFAPFVLARPSSAALKRRFNRVVVVGAISQVVGLLLFTTDQALSSNLPFRSYLLDTVFGRGLAARDLLALAFLALVPAAGRLPSKYLVPAQRLLSLGLLLVTAAFSHGAAALQPRPLGIATDAVHLGAVCVWAGGLACLAIALRTDSARGDTLRRRLGPVLHRFHLLALACVGLLTLTGVLLLFGLLGWNPLAWWDHRTTPYGQLLAAKVGLAVAMILSGGLNRLHYARHLERGRRVYARHNFRRLVAAEFALGLLVFALAGTVTNFSPSLTDNASMGPKPQILEEDGEFVHLVVTIQPPPSVANESVFDIHVIRLSDGSPVLDAFRVRLSFQYLDANLGGAGALADPAGEGHYKTSGSYFPSAGAWRLQVAVQAPDVYLDTVSFDLRVPALT